MFFFLGMSFIWVLGFLNWSSNFLPLGLSVLHSGKFFNLFFKTSIEHFTSFIIFKNNPKLFIWIFFFNSKAGVRMGWGVSCWSLYKLSTSPPVWQLFPAPLPSKTHSTSEAWVLLRAYSRLWIPSCSLSLQAWGPTVSRVLRHFPQSIYLMPSTFCWCCPSTVASFDIGLSYQTGNPMRPRTGFVLLTSKHYPWIFTSICWIHKVKRAKLSFPGWDGKERQKCTLITRGWHVQEIIGDRKQGTSRPWHSWAFPQWRVQGRDFPGSLVAKTLLSQCREPRSDPWLGN